MQIGIDSFAAAIPTRPQGLTFRPVERMHHLLEEIELADKVGLDVFGEHHRAEFLDSAPVVILSAAATRTENIRRRHPSLNRIMKGLPVDPPEMAVTARIADYMVRTARNRALPSATRS
jgi:hypothetical protein